MKKISRVFAVPVFSFLLCLVAGTIFSCSDINTDAYVFYSASSIVSNGGKNVRLIVSSGANLLSANSSRQIVPDAYNSSDLDFYLGGKNIGTDENLALQKVEFVPSAKSSSEGTITVPLNSYNYQLVLLAIPKTVSISLDDSTVVKDLVPYAALAGSSTADLRYSGDSDVNFYLSSNGLSGSGSYEIKCYLNKWSSKSLSATDSENSNAYVVSNVSFALYEIVGDGTISGTSRAGESFGSAISEDSAITFSSDSVPSGVYDLRLTFSCNGNDFVYSDKIQILPYQKTKATLPIPDILQSVPDAPTEFQQGYISPANDESDYYRVVFAWEDNSNTETGFELQFLDVTDIATITTESKNTQDVWDTVSTSCITSYSTNFLGSVSWYAGNLSRNSTGAVFYVPLGKRYLARLRSVNNDVGSSPWCYAESDKVSLTIPYGESTATSVILTDNEILNGTAFPSPIINVFKVAYNLVGGISSPSIDKSYYFSQSSAGAAILTPDGSSMNGRKIYKNLPISLSKGNGEWDSWRISSTSGEKYPMNFTQCSSVADYDADATYYQPASLTSKDINGNPVYEKVPTPDSFSDYSNTYLNYWSTDGTLANYVGYKNLSLYADYKENGSDTDDSDYSITTNLMITISADGADCDLSNYAFTISKNTATLTVSCSPKTESNVTYDSFSFIVSENGGNEIKNETVTPNTTVTQFTLNPATLNSENAYTLTVKATKSGAEFKKSYIMILQ